ncbi:MAG: four helix bundle protein [Dehalococcoidia bacterium]
MDASEFKRRTKVFAADVITLTETLPRGRAVDVIARQLIRSGSSAGANYRAATRAQSTAHMISKLATVEEEADESIYWLELLVETGFLKPDAAAPLQREASQMVAMTVASKKTLRLRIRPAIKRQSQIVDRKSKPSTEPGS